MELLGNIHVLLLKFLDLLPIYQHQVDPTVVQHIELQEDIQLDEFLYLVILDRLKRVDVSQLPSDQPYRISILGDQA